MSWSIPIQISRLVDDLNNKTGFSALQVQNNSTFLSNLNVAGTLTANTSVSIISIITQLSELNVSGKTILQGQASVNSSLNVSGDSILNDLYLYNLSGLSNITYGLTTDNNGKIIGGPVGSTTLSALYVSGNSTLQSDLLVSGTTNLQNLNTLNITGNGNLNVSGTSNMIGASTFNSSLNVSGLSTLNNVIITGSLTGTSNINISGNSQINGSTTLLSTLNVSGFSYLNGNIIGDNITVASKLYVNNSIEGHDHLLIRKNITGLSDINISGNSIFGLASTMRSSLNVSGTTRFNSDVLITSLSGSSSLAVDNTGKLVAGSGVGSSTVLSSLLVSGNTTMFSDLRVSGLTILGGVANIGQGQLQVLGTGVNAELCADFRGTGNENIVCIGSNTNLNQAIYMGHISSTSQLVIGQRATRQIMYFNTSGNTNIGIYNSNPSSTLHISGTTIINNGTTIGSSLNVSGATRIENNLSVAGPITTNSSLYISGATTLLSSLNICNITGQSCIIETFGQGASSFTRFYCDRGLRPHFLSELQIFSGAIGSEVKRLSLTSNGYIGVGNTTAKDTPQNPIDVRYDGSTGGASTSALRFGDDNGTGILAAGSGSAGMYNSAFNGFIRILQGSTGLESSGTITNVSDERIKENIKDITEDPIDIINQIRPVEYHHKLDPPNKITHGLIAQEVEKILPCAIEKRKIRLSEDIEFEDGRALDYNCVNMYHIKATQQLIKLVNQLKLRIEILENEIKLLKG